MGLRPGRTKGPWVGTDTGENNTASNVGGGCGIFKQKTGVDLEFKSLLAGDLISITCGSDAVTITALPTLTNAAGGAGDAQIFSQRVGDAFELRELVSGANISITQSPDTIQISSTGGSSVAVSSNDTTPGYLSDKVSAEIGLTDAIRNPSGDEVLEIDILPGFRDDFTEASLKPFWVGTDAITSGDWQLDAANDTLDGIAQNNTRDSYRTGIEGDFDHAMKIDRNSASSCGFYFESGDGTILVRFAFTSAIYEIWCTGKTTYQPANSLTIQWLRVKRVGSTIYFLQKENDTDAWTLLHTYTDVALGHDVSAQLDSATSAEILQFIAHDNTFPQRTRSDYTKYVPLTDAATIAVDASLGNLFRVTLGGNRTMGAPTNPHDGQMIMFRIKQDVTGTRTLAWNAIYRFPAAIPSPTITPTGGRFDYIGFIYNGTDTKWDCIALVQDYT